PRSYTLRIKSSPTVTSASPNTMDRGASNRTVTISGTNFLAGATAAFAPNAGLTVSNPPNVVNSTTMTVTISVSSSATLGAHNITVTNTDGGTATGTGVFTVQGPPTVASVSPSSVTRGPTKTVTV